MPTKKKQKALVIGVGIILSVLLILIVNVSVSYFYKSPNYEDYCDYSKPLETGQDYTECQNNYDKAMDSYNLVRFFIFSIIGFILLILGLIFDDLLKQLISLATGGVFVTESIVMNWDSKLSVIIVSSLIFVIVLLFAIKKFKGKLW